MTLSPGLSALRRRSPGAPPKGEPTLSPLRPGFARALRSSPKGGAMNQC
nr:MAG TPA: hypothetical protein [Caudoviricetes sp.]